MRWRWKYVERSESREVVVDGRVVSQVGELARGNVAAWLEVGRR